MKKNSSRSKVRGIAVFIVLLAIAITSFQTYKQASVKTSIDTRDADARFANTSWMHKTKLFVSAKDANNAIKQVNTLMNEYQVGSPVQVVEAKNTGTYIFVVNNDNMPTIKEKLAAVGSIGSSESVTDTSLVSTSVEIENQRLTSYQNERSTLDAIRLRSEPENRRMAVLDELISRTLDKLQRLQASGSTLLYVVIAPPSRGAGLSSTIMFAGKQFVIWFFALSLAVLIVYFGTKLLMYILSLLGVKGMGLENVLQNYAYRGYDKYSGYQGKYNYGYTGRNKKVKRVYKDKRSTPEGEDQETRD